MISTLSERLREAMKGPPVVNGLQLAKACGVKPASVSGWLSGKSKSMEGSNLLAAARLLNVDPDWLATGVGRKERFTGVAQELARYDIHHAGSWPFHTVSLAEVNDLTQFELGQVEGFIKGLRPSARPDDRKSSNGV